MGVGFCPQLGGVGPCPAQCIWQGSGFAADQTNAMLAVVRADDESLVPPQEAAGLALSVARPLPAETASLGFGGNPVGGVIKLPVYIFRRSYMGGYHYPRRAIHAVETLDARGSRRLIRRFCAVSEFALCGLNIPSAGTHANPAPNRAHSGSHGETRGIFTARDIVRVDRVNSLGTLCIVTFGTAQFDKPLSVAAAHHGGNTDFA